MPGDRDLMTDAAAHSVTWEREYAAGDRSQVGRERRAVGDRGDGAVDGELLGTRWTPRQLPAPLPRPRRSLEAFGSQMLNDVRMSGGSRRWLSARQTERAAGGMERTVAS